jgi:sulfofructose kinase
VLSVGRSFAIGAADRDPSFDVIGMGCCCWDYLGVVAGYPALDEKVAMKELVQQGGGQAGTAMVAVARLGGKAAIFGRVGEDEFGRHVREAFEVEGVDTTWLVAVPGATSQFAFCVIDESSGKRTIYYIHGTKGKFAPDELPREKVLDCKCLLLDGHHNIAAVAVAGWAREEGVPVVLDLERPQAQDEQLVSLASHPIVPEEFALDFAGEADLRAAGEAMLERGPEVVVITRGDKGAVAFNGEAAIEQPALRVEPVVDTTGAGDVFHGAFAYGVALGYDLARNLRFSSAVAALKCRALGGRAGIPTMDEALALMEAQR